MCHAQLQGSVPLVSAEISGVRQSLRGMKHPEGAHLPSPVRLNLKKVCARTKLEERTGGQLKHRAANATSADKAREPGLG